MEGIKVLLFQSTTTQRLTLTKNPDGSCLLSKEWRKDFMEPWVQGKGITIPAQYVSSIGQLLMSNVEEVTKYGFDCIERVDNSEREEKGDFTNKKNSHNWRKTYFNYRKQNPLGRSSR